MITFSETQTTCVCTHNTTFSILFQVDGDNKLFSPTSSSLGGDILIVLEQLLLTISTVALIVGLIILCYLRGLRNCIRTSIHKHLMLTLALSQIVFLIGFDKTSNQSVCTGVAALLLYLYLAAFTWMFAEAVYLHYKIYDIHKTSVHYQRISRYILFCYGIPLVIVGVALACNVDGFGTDRSCWLSTSNGFVWTFIGPVYFICSANLVLILKVAKTIYTRSKGHCNKNQKEEIAMTRKAIKGALILVPLLGVTWLFGIVIAFTGGTMLFSYIFAVLNGSQGLAIFLVCIVFSPQVKDELKKHKWLKRLFRRVDPMQSEPQTIQTTSSFSTTRTKSGGLL
ncbi:latrophilin-like protein LAT-2 [Antedon mediterranea]|uniref:latrophilin-like protein LAT-2 n=1 Tax=Antedon mediterranea TaxID=105859 RepID=UPI003AF443C8